MAHSVKWIVVQGKSYKVEDLARISGLTTNGILGRYYDNKNISYAELTKPMFRTATLTVDGVTNRLPIWARIVGIPEQTVRSRYKRGKRTFEELFCPVYSREKDKQQPFIVTKEMKRWLEETRYARRGRPDEWQIACELIGVSRSRAEELKKMMEGNSDGTAD